MEGQTQPPRRTPEPFQIIQFVNPNTNQGAGSVNFIRSHAARVTHARRRRARHAAQAGSTTSTTSNSEGHGQERTHPAGEHRPHPQALGLIRVPSPETIGSERCDPFSTLSRPLHPMETFLLDHYIAHILPIFKATCRGLRTNGKLYADALMTGWVRMGLHDPQCLNSLFLTASRHLAVMHQDEALQGRRGMFTDMAVRYKVMAVRAVSQAISNTKSTEDASGRPFRDVVVMETLGLAFDEAILKDIDMMRRHVQGVLDMVRQNGGWDTLGLNGFLEMVIFEYLGRTGLLFKADFPPDEAGQGTG